MKLDDLPTVRCARCKRVLWHGNQCAGAGFYAGNEIVGDGPPVLVEGEWYCRTPCNEERLAEIIPSHWMAL